uniref:Uncharacterized protein n=1 Tax=Oryza sativa subsp. japonica TaxID=39947 RepID=Q6ZG10_ORYSJ|nr:hypothetical protein [Oryza sativa Japonica Group]BAC99479.1 hypothetical protein [Oryza sativa Japonica Group]
MGDRPGILWPRGDVPGLGLVDGDVFPVRTSEVADVAKRATSWCARVRWPGVNRRGTWRRGDVPGLGLIDGDVFPVRTSEDKLSLFGGGRENDEEDRRGRRSFIGKGDEDSRGSTTSALDPSLPLLAAARRSPHPSLSLSSLLFQATAQDLRRQLRRARAMATAARWPRRGSVVVARASGGGGDSGDRALPFARSGGGRRGGASGGRGRRQRGRRCRQRVAGWPDPAAGGVARGREAAEDPPAGKSPPLRQIWREGRRRQGR